MFQFCMRNDNFVCKINFHVWIFHFINKIRVSHTKILQMKFWAMSFYMWIRHFIHENVPYSHVKWKFHIVYEVVPLPCVFHIWTDKWNFCKGFRKLVNDSCFMVTNPWTHTTSDACMHFDTQWKPVVNSTNWRSGLHLLIYIFKSMKQTCNKSLGTFVFYEGTPNTQKQQNHGATLYGFCLCLVFETPDETIKLVSEPVA